MATAATSSSVCHVGSVTAGAAQSAASHDRSSQRAVPRAMASVALARSAAIFGGNGSATCSVPDVAAVLKRGQSAAATFGLDAAGSSSSSSSRRRRTRGVIADAKLNRTEEDDEHKSQLILRANAAALTAATTVVLGGAGPAHAEGVHIEDLQAAIDQVVDVSKQIADGAAVGYEVAKTLFESVLAALKPAVEVAAPVVQQATDVTIRAAVPVAESLAEEAQKALEQAGIDTHPALEAAKTAVTVAGDATEQVTEAVRAAQPLAESTLENVLASDPLVLVIGAGALLLLYLLAPSIAGTVASATRGYTVYAVTDSPFSVLAIVKRSCDTAKAVARSLSTMGFRNVYVVQGGFSGSTGWLQSRLGSEPYYFGEPMILSPSRILSGTKQILTSNGGRSSGTTRRQVDAEIVRKPRLSLPSARE
ncbi:hypothetical protein CBR_g8983 [Chara braunii]|uniref:Rhodanese domain-containing protein n=1 Tax=Chara braunii TaxID=69332 RepID=A0A388KNF5_CHABU|nr:hypothetical protein CBR_g8983 [Chara braunii]|eukprot:GBG71567.1 hypothetical protein CBR_g8983 [Chara braunii]